MKIQKSLHKNLLLSCFFKNGAPKEVSDRNAAQSAFNRMVDKDQKINEEEVEFTPSEIVVLKQLFDQKTEWPWNIPDEVLKELKDIFYPSQNG